MLFTAFVSMLKCWERGMDIGLVIVKYLHGLQGLNYELANVLDHDNYKSYKSTAKLISTDVASQINSYHTH